MDDEESDFDFNSEGDEDIFDEDAFDDENLGNEDMWEDEEWGQDENEDEMVEKEDGEFIEKNDFDYENIFGNEYNVFDRTSTYVDYDVGGDKNAKKTQDPVERLKININAISIDLKNHYDNITFDDSGFMIENISKLNKPEYKNASAYVLGYLVIKGSGGKLIKKNINIVFDKCLAYIQDSSVKKPDVIRYARLWLNL